ncbi:DUF2075 domain-containing protein [Kitasatospora sp. NPDC004799]|uniref:DUF2075 domain-containing protein n=1 Tax=Kitasatospora sp. NPDC004799 TaxID=3154460 RepID=UPI0033B2B221
MGILVLLQLSAAELGRLIVVPAGSGHSPLTERLIDEHVALKDRPASRGDIEAWNNSIPVVVRALLECGLGEVEVQVEVSLPHTDSAVDLVLCGRRPGTGADSYVAVELKQARHATVDPECPTAVDLGFSDGKLKLHPVRQVQNYCDYMMRYLPHLRESDDRLTGVVLLHNARDADVEALFELSESDYGSLYTLDDLARFRRVLTSRFTAESGKRAARALEESRREPLPKITDVARQRSVVGGGLVLLDEQFLAFDRIVRHLEKTSLPREFNVGLFHDEDAPTPDSGRKKRVHILRGGPGSGKSAVALQLQRELGLKGHEAVLASGSHAYTETLRGDMVDAARQGQKSRRSRAANRLYRYFNSFVETSPDEIEVLICDEAHRTRRTSTDRFTRAERRDDETPQAIELIRASQVPIFLLDDHQSIRPDEVGTADYLKKIAEDEGCLVEVTDLEGTFRAGGSRRYQSWVQQLLGLGDSDPVPWRPDGRMTVLVADSPAQMEQFIQERDLEGATARITAGFCWPWSKPKGGSLVDDVRIGEWRQPWNVKPTYKVPYAPVSDRWATDRRGVGQIGCVYTAQTFEYDWNGVIIGPDLVFRDGKFKVERAASHDPAFSRSVDDEVVGRCIRNAYHVLLTRGVVGTVVYAVDPATQRELRRLITGAIGLQNYRRAQSKLTAEGSQLPPALNKRRR